MTRLLAGGAVAVAIWLVGATQVPARPSMRLADVVVGAAITQSFGCTSLELEPFDDLCPWHHRHTGVDLAAPIGTEVHSATNGTALAGFDPSGCGTYILVVLDTHVRVLYCHLSVVRAASGSSVQTDQVIGLVGESGVTTGPHVHLQVDVDGVPVDPATWLGS